MASLKFKTRGKRSPQGLPRVYFCAHPKDFGRFFESISDEILSKQNCAIWYDEDPSAERDDEFYYDLKQMQLFVMPVTSELLYTPNRALSEEFRFAMENHIPVLPLMQESGLDKAFNEKCGDLQYLDKNSRDATAISYDEKLEKYLSSVLIGDEMAAKVRAAFDAYVFLSYRKKDRRYAQELMRLIHKNDFCRDIAIWYDEFLTPGENFNDSIKAALQKSGLFVLAVTPNLVNEVNYIMTTEYPMAREEGKPILPAELVPTDRNLLAEKYADIPNCTDAHNDSELSAVLLEAIKNIAIKENNNSPEHNFFIGLAYLSGIDVEVDHEKPVKLITFAAEHNVVEAIDKLIEMYRNGIGVERDYLKAIQWQEKKINLFEERYNSDPSEDNQNALFRCIIKCGDYYKELGKLSKAKEKYEQAQELFSDISSDTLVKRQKRNYSVCCSRIGNICQAEGKLSEARAYYEKGLEIRIALAEETGTVKAKRDLSISYNNLGNICKAEGNLNGAKGYYEKMFEIFLALAEETGTVKAKRDLSISYNNLGNICVAEGDLSEARAYYEKGLEISIALAEETGTVEAKRDLSISYNNLGDICGAEGKLSEARAYYEKGLEISIALSEDMGTVKAKRDLSISYNNLGDICQAEGKLSQARAYYEKGLEIRIALAEETGTVEAKRDLSVSYDKLGDIFKAEGDLSGAREYYEKGLEIFIALSEETGTVEAKRDLSISYNNLGNICKAEGNLNGAREYYEKSLKIDLALAEETSTVEAKRDLSISYNKLGDICEAEGDISGARGYYEKSLEIRLSLAEETGTVEARRNLSISYNNLGDICQAEGNLSEARGYYEKSLEIRLALEEETGTVEAKRDLSISYERLGDICEAEGDINDARGYYEKGLEIRLALAKATSTAKSYDDLAVSYYKLSFCDTDKKQEYLTKAVEIYEILIRNCPGVVRYQKNLDIIKRML